MLKNILILTFAGLVSLSADADIYSWKNDSGNTVYSDQHRSGKTIAETSTNRTNHYSADRNHKATESPSATIVAVATTQAATTQLNPAALSATTDHGSPAITMTETECQQQYRLSCDRVENWKQYASDACDDDPRCLDDDFLDRKYRPRTIEEMRKIAQRAAIRNNLQDEQIALFLTKKYSNYCANQAAMYCQDKRDSECAATMRSYCADSRDLADIFRKYDNLSAVEKQQIISQAKSLAMSSGDNALDYDQLVASLIELLVSQTLLGL